jgi:hypothetical protein
MQNAKAGWARIQLVRGHSTGQTWQIDSQYPEARLSVGSAPDAGWSVQWPGVQPVHFELFWDGKGLYIADTRRAGGVTVNGRAVTEWIQIRGRSEITFGGASMVCETSEGGQTEMSSNPGAAKRVSWNDGSLPGEATRVATPLDEAGASATAPPGAWKPMSPESTRIAEEGAPLPPVQSSVGKPPSGPINPPQMRPRLGASPGGGAERPPARTVNAAEMAQHVAALGPATSGDPNAGPSVVVQAGYPQQQHPPSGQYSAVGGPPGGPGGPGGQGFAAPPSFEAAAAGAGGPAPKKKLPVPVRTIVLGLFAIVALVAVLFMLPGPEPAAPAPAVAAGVPPPLPPGTPPGTVPPGTVAPGAVPGAVPPGTAPGAMVAPGTVPPVVPGVAPIAPIAPVPVAPAVDPTLPPATPVGPTPDRVAADLVITGRYAEALVQYQALAAAHPERAEYAQMIRILQQRLAERCQGGVGPDGRPCVGR